jgi:hypothetical protein
MPGLPSLTSPALSSMKMKVQGQIAAQRDRITCSVHQKLWRPFQDVSNGPTIIAPTSKMVEKLRSSHHAIRLMTAIFASILAFRVSRVSLDTIFQYGYQEK